ncbi:MAG: hypothetical protein MI808_22760 [Pseudomonadales bacterium]|nr:hypothetical protein [Pseudomonadales bacterium]
MTQDSMGDLSMKPTRDELAQRQTTKSKPAKAPKGAPTPPSKKPPSGGDTPVVLWSLVILLLVIGGAGGWYLWDKSEKLQARLDESAQSSQANERLFSNLQDTLKNRDATLSKSGDQMADDIKLLQSEVRKLWDLSNKRNKKDIAAMQKQVAQLQSDLKGSRGTLSGMSKEVKATAGALESLKKQLSELKENNQTLTQLVNSQQGDLSALKASVGSAADVEDRITSLEVSIQAIDAHRQQVNGRLQQLDQEIGRLVQSSSSGG